MGAVKFDTVETKFLRSDGGVDELRDRGLDFSFGHGFPKLLAGNLDP